MAADDSGGACAATIDRHGVIGNMRSAALVSDAGVIDFFCFPDFDSPSVIAGLLGDERGSEFSLRPAGEGFRCKQTYVPDTNVLVTRFLSEQAIAEITDFMPVGAPDAVNGIMRRVSVLHGEIEFRLRCVVAFGYGSCPHAARLTRVGVLLEPAGDRSPALLLGSDIELQIEETPRPAAPEGESPSTVTPSAAPSDAEASGAEAFEAASPRVAASFVLSKGSDAHFFLGGVPESADDVDIGAWVRSELAATCLYWQHWSGKASYDGRWREFVLRSALTLKLLTSAQHGSLLAAPTFGLPENPGGVRNWDYRYVWLRDASFSLYALSRLGYVEEGQRFTAWLKDRVHLDSPDGPLQVMYRADGGPVPAETELAGFSGYRQSSPVRVGNGAKGQLQLDVYGALFDALYLSSKYGDGIPYQGWLRIKTVMRWLSDHWRDPDEGIWEVRGGRREFLHSRLMCWVAFDRVIRLGAKRSLPGPFEAMESCRDEIVADIHEHFWNEDIGAFVQYKGATRVDASVLLMPLVRFISPNDPRWTSTLAVVERDLMVDCFVKRYATDGSVDGLDGGEGCFTACAFWMVEALARSHQTEKARRMLEKLLSHANPLGLYAEEFSVAGVSLGNFPQALTHLALISAVTYLDRRLNDGRAETWA